MRPIVLVRCFKTVMHLAGVLMLVGLAACQVPASPTPTLPRVTASVTATSSPTRTPLPPTATPTVTPTISPTVLPVVRELRGTQVDFWHPWVGSSETYLRALVQEFNARNEWGIRVQAISVGGIGEIDRRIHASQASDLPDLVVAYPEQALSWQTETLVLADLAQYILDPDFGFKAQDVIDYPAVFWDTYAEGTPRYGLPAQRSLVVMLYNQTWARELGFKVPPSTPEEFRLQACAAMTANIEDDDPKNDGTGGWLVDESPMVALSWLVGFGAPGFNGASETALFDTPQARQALWFVKSLVDEGCAWKSRQPAPYDYFAQRYALIYAGSLEDLAEQANAITRLGVKDEWTVLPFPSIDETPIVLTFGPSYYLFASEESGQLAAWLFLRWLTAPGQEVRFIRSAGTYPLRASVIPMLDDYRKILPAWGAALPLIEYAQAIPADLAWGHVRPLLQDAMHQLIQPETKIEQIPDILQMMQEMVLELLNP